MQFIQNEQNCGYSAGNNIGIRQALDNDRDAVLISNSDVRYEKGSISKMYQYLQKNPKTGIVGPKIVLRDGSTQKECMMKKTGIREKYLLRTRFYMLFPKLNNEGHREKHDYERNFSVYAVLGLVLCLVGMSQRLLHLMRLHFCMKKELILGIVMEQAGWETVYYPEKVIYLHGNSTEKVKAFAITAMYAAKFTIAADIWG